MISFFRKIIYTPLYNLLVLLTAFVPGHSVAVSIILVTVLVKVVLFPFNKKSIVSQIKLKELEPKINEVKEQYKDDKSLQAQKTFEIYKKYGVSPFSGCLPILIQVPVILSLYYVFINGLDINSDIIYAGTRIPEFVNTNFLGITDLAGKSIILAVLAGITQFFVVRLSQKRTVQEKPSEKKDGSFQSNIAKTLQVQMKYFLPVFITFIAWQISGAIALYWTVNNLITIAQEYFIQKRFNKNKNSLETAPEAVVVGTEE